MPRIYVPHPVHRHQMDAGVTVDEAMRWTGRSRQTVLRWAKAGRCPDVGLARLLALYAHGMPPIRPEHYQHPCCQEWALMRFSFDYQRPIRRRTENPADRYQWALLTYHSGQALGVMEVDGAGYMRASFDGLCHELGTWRDRARAAEAEAARLRELVAYGAC